MSESILSEKERIILETREFEDRLGYFVGHTVDEQSRAEIRECVNQYLYKIEQISPFEEPLDPSKVTVEFIFAAKHIWDTPIPTVKVSEYTESLFKEIRKKVEQ